MARGSRLLLWLVVLAGLGAFGYYVWPTPWRELQSKDAPMRENRFTGEVQMFYRALGWRTVGKRPGR